MTAADGREELESVDSFTARAREWLRHNMAPSPARVRPRAAGSDEDELARVAHSRDLQRRLYDGGFAGICVPKAYGGLGLTAAHQAAFNREIDGYDYPVETQVPTFTPCLAVILEFGNEEQKCAHVAPILRGETTWMQMLSEPSGGSDVAGALTTAVRDGDEWVLNGSKIWTTGAWWADWALCLARTNWDVPKHRGLTVFMVPLHQPGIEIHRIEMLNGSREFCQEFMTDVRLPDELRIGDVDQGWTVGVRWMYHERTVAGGSPYVTGDPVRMRLGPGSSRGVEALVRRARVSGTLADPRVRELIGESRAMTIVGEALVAHIADGIRTGVLVDQAAAIIRLYTGVSLARATTIAFELAGAGAVAWPVDEEQSSQAGIGFLMRQTACIGGGTTEMARNVISERVLGMPREMSLDRDVPFRSVPRNTSSR
jgi:alkylation response protein AidB-like acyl-CoA dehydrogenase